MAATIFDRPEFNAALFYPRADVSRTPAGARDTYIDVLGARLHVRTYGDALPVLLLFHGNGEVVADYDDAAEHFARAGVSLAVVDYRGYGASTGTPSLRHLIEDARVVAEAVQPAFVMGRSLGGAAAHELFARPVASMRGVVLESAFSDLGALIRRRGLEAPRAFADDVLAVFDPTEKLRRGTLPLLVVHGERDELIVPDEARVAYKAAGARNKSIAFIPDRGHNDLSLTPLYWRHLAIFVDQTRTAGTTEAIHPWSSSEVDIVTAGELVLPSGAIVACDPLVSLAGARPFTRTVSPGTYRVVIARQGGDTVYAAVMLAEGAPVRWEPAWFAGQDIGAGVPGYGVDAGTGCFVDATVAATWHSIETAWRDDRARQIIASGVDPADADAWHAAYREREAERPDLLARLRAAGYERRPYAALEIDGGTLVAFTSGAGDGVYPSYWGLDGNGRAAVLLTDFGLLAKAEEPDEEPEVGDPRTVRLATEILDRLIREKHVELTRRCTRDALRDDLAADLAGFLDDGAPAFADWLSAHPGVDEVFASDDDLERVIAEASRT